MIKSGLKIALYFSILFFLSINFNFLVNEGMKRSQGDPPEDFFQYYVQSIRLQKNVDVYNSRALHEEIENRLGWSFNELPAANPPVLILMSWPLSFMHYKMAWWSLFIFSVITIFFCSYFVAKVCGYSCIDSVFLGFSSLCIFPNSVLLILNHIESILLLSLVAGWIFFKKEKKAKGAIMWGIAASIKLFPALYLVPLINYRFRNIGTISLVVALSATAFGVIFIGWDQTLVYLVEIIPGSRSFYSSHGNFSVLAAGTAMNSVVLGWSLEILIGFFIFVTLVWNPVSIDKIFVTATAGSLMLSPLSWSYYFIIIPPALIVLSNYLSFDKFKDCFLIYFLILTTLLWPSLLGAWTKNIFRFQATEIEIFLRFVPTYGLFSLFLAGLKKVR